MSSPYYTIGHSTRTIEQFAALMREAGADMVIDVRTVPRSRLNPHFNTDRFPIAMAVHDIGYRHIARLGGLRGPQTDGRSANDFWKGGGFRNYADYAMTRDFRDGLAELQSLSKSHVCAIMCAEAVWSQCHRRFIADYLLATGETVLHIVSPGRIDPAAITPEAELRDDGALAYPSREPRFLL